MIAMLVLSLQFVWVYLMPAATGYQGWLVFAFLLGRVLGIYHPTVYFDQPLDAKRKVLGWLALLVFALCFSPTPFIV